MKTKTVFVNFCAGIFIFLFTYTALNKLINLYSFQYTIGQSPYINQYRKLISILVPSVELATVVLLFFPQTKMFGLYGSLALMLAFTMYVGSMLLWASKLPCSCGGIIQRLSWRDHLLFNISLTILAVTAVSIKNVARQRQKILLQ